MEQAGNRNSPNRVENRFTGTRNSRAARSPFESCLRQSSPPQADGLPKKDDPNKIKLSQSDQWWLRQNYPHIRTEICALKLGISLRSCVRLARKLGVEKTALFMKEAQAFTARKAKESHLAHGTYPPKGVINENIAKGKAYRFKPGHKPNQKKKEVCKSMQE